MACGCGEVQGGPNGAAPENPHLGGTWCVLAPCRERARLHLYEDCGDTARYGGASFCSWVHLRDYAALQRLEEPALPALRRGDIVEIGAGTGRGAALTGQCGVVTTQGVDWDGDARVIPSGDSDAAYVSASRLTVVGHVDLP